MTAEHNGAFSHTFTARKRWAVDPDLWRALLAVLPDETTRIVDLGAGIGRYVQALAEQGHFAAGVDGTPGITSLSGGRVLEYDLTKLIRWNPPAQWALCIEVGEHIPPAHEDIFLDNLATAATAGLIVSWAPPGQRGRDHVNCQTPTWVRQRLATRGWELDAERTALAQQTAGGGWAKKLQVFRRESTNKGAQ
jgi:hypothetical protein